MSLPQSLSLRAESSMDLHSAIAIIVITATELSNSHRLLTVHVHYHVIRFHISHRRRPVGDVVTSPTTCWSEALPQHYLAIYRNITSDKLVS